MLQLYQLASLNILLKLIKEVSIIITEIKQKFYNILTSIGYEPVDSVESIEDNTPFPHVILKLGTTKRERVRDVVLNQMRFVIDIFSEYNGEAEILDIEQKIFDATKSLYDIDKVVYVQESSFRILDDKSTGVVMKHGILTYMVMSTGMEQEVEEEDENSGTS